MRVKILLLAALALVLSGCQQVADKAVEQATGIKVDQKGESVTIKGKDGEVVTFSAKLPDELKDFPVPQGFDHAEGSFGAMSAKKSERVATAVWRGKTAVETVVQFYKKGIADKGWKEESTFSTGDGFQGYYSKADAEAVVTVIKEGEITSINVIVGKGIKKNEPNTALSSSAPGSGSADSKPANQPAISSSTPVTSLKPGQTTQLTSPQTSDAASIPQELKSIPVPSGFKVVKDSVNRLAEGGVFKVGTVMYYGTSNLKQVVDFYTNSMSSDWTSELEGVMEEEAFFEFVNKKDATLRLAIGVAKAEAGTEITIMLTKD